jgi:hypothetical protein
VSILIYIEKGLFIDIPGGGKTPPEAKLFIPVNQTLKYHGTDIAAGRVCREDGIQDAGITDGCGNVFVKTLGIGT